MFWRKDPSDTIDKWEKKRKVKKLISALEGTSFRSNSWDYRSEAASALGAIGDNKAVDPLICSLKDEIWEVRKSVVEALGKIGGNKVVEPLICSLKDEHWLVQKSAVETLGKIGCTPSNTLELLDYLISEGRLEELVEVGEPAVDRLVIALKDENSNRVHSPRVYIVQTLIKLGVPRSELVAVAVEPLICNLEMELREYGVVDIDRMCLIAETLGEIGDPRAIEPLMSLFKFDGRGCYRVRATVAKVLAQIDVGRETKEALIETLTSDLRKGEDYANECLKILGWVPKSKEDLIDLCLAEKNVAELKIIGGSAIERMIYLFRQIPHVPASESLSYSGSFGSRILVCLGEMDDKAAHDVLITEVKGRGSFCKIARDVLNRGKSYEEEHCLCPKCFTYMGVRNHLRSKGAKVSGQMRQEARRNKMTIIGDSYSRCPGCGDRILV